MQNADHEQGKGLLQFAHLHDLPAVLGSHRSRKPAHSILKAVA
jgi:hypothetical protein